VYVPYYPWGRWIAWLEAILLTLILLAGLGLLVVRILQLFNIPLPVGLLSVIVSPTVVVLVLSSFVILSAVELVKYHRRPRPKPLTFFQNLETETDLSDEKKED
jgi:membrane protein implicated in regulation of membrane protease activity